MAAPINKKTDTAYDYFGPRSKYSLHIGTPSKRLLHRCGQLIADSAKDAVEREIESNDCLAGVLQYGYPVGDDNFRNHLAEFLTKQYGSPVKSDNLVQTSGASLGLIFLLTHLFPNRVPIYVENITYFRTLHILRGWGYEIRSIRTELAGIDTEQMEEVWKRDLSSVKTERDDYAAVLYLIPQYSNPMGTVLGEEKSKEIIRLARKYNVLVLCDDIYNIHYHDGVTHKRLFAYDLETDPDYDKDHVVSNCSFSKLLFPALRLGWVEAGPVVRRKCFEEGVITTSGGGLNAFAAAVITELIRNGKAYEHVELVRNDAARKMRITLEILEKHLPSKCSVIYKPAGGYFIFVLLPMTISATFASDYLKDKYDVLVTDGRSCWAGDKNDPEYPMCNGLRIAIPYLEEDHLALAIKLFCVGLTELCEESNNNQI